MADANLLLRAQQATGNGNPFFNLIPDKITGSDKTVAKMVPKGGSKIVDVYNNMHWRYRSSTADLEVPQLTLTEYEVTESRILANWDNIISQFKDHSITDAYKQLYVGERTGFVYNVPWLFGAGSSLIDMNQTWDEYDSLKLFPTVTGSSKSDSKSSSKSGKLGMALNAYAFVKEMAAGASGGAAGADSVSWFKNTAKRSIEVSFPLFNTVSPQQTYINYCFVLLLSFQNLMTRTSFFTFRPPKIYQVSTSNYGGIYMPVAYLGNINIQSIGTTRILKEFSDVNSSIHSQGLMVPEAYKVSFTIKEALPLSTNIYAATFGAKQVEVIEKGVISNVTKPVAEAAKTVVGAVESGLGTAGKFISDLFK